MVDAPQIVIFFDKFFLSSPKGGTGTKCRQLVSLKSDPVSTNKAIKKRSDGREEKTIKKNIKKNTSR